MNTAINYLSSYRYICIYTVKSIIQPAGYKGYRCFWGRAIVKGAGYLLSKFTKKRNFSRKNSKCGLYSRAGCIIGFTVLMINMNRIF